MGHCRRIYSIFFNIFKIHDLHPNIFVNKRFRKIYYTKHSINHFIILISLLTQTVHTNIVY